MIDKINREGLETNETPNGETETTSTAIATVDAAKKLQEESKKVVDKILALEKVDEKDDEELISIFNQYQNKKSIARINKYSEVLDTLTDSFMERITKNPNNISNKDLTETMKIIQDLKTQEEQRFEADVDPAPFIQVNQQTNNINGDGQKALSKSSRQKVQNTVEQLLTFLNQGNGSQTIDSTDDVEDNSEVMDNDR